MSRWRLLAMTALPLAGLPQLALAQQAPPAAQPADQSAPETWPKTLNASDQQIQIYAPQIETWQGDTLSGTAAIAIGPQGQAPHFGQAHFTAHVAPEASGGAMHVDQIQIGQVDIPTEPSEDGMVQQTLQSHLPAGGVSVPGELLKNAFQASQQATKADSAPLQNDPPRVIFSAVPAALIPVDGEPALRPLPGTDYQRVINTAPLLLQDQHNTWFLLAADHWYTASSLDGPWSVLTNPPQALDAAKAAASQQQKFDPIEPPQGAPAAPPAIYVSTTPTELVVTNGQPQFAPVTGTLLEMRNADHAVFMESASNSYYLLISGRWFTAANLTGPWSYVDPSQLPPDFAHIPANDPMANALASVPGTAQAQDAEIACSIPQTATVDRSQASLSVAYDGAPSFQPIEGTSLNYAVNTATPVIEVAPSSYYALSGGVWFSAGAAIGPWRVAAFVPPAIYGIPYASPLHYVTYAHVYWATPARVWVGYTPGYFGIVARPGFPVVYGTGYWYHPYIGRVWYGRPFTYGFGARFAVGAGIGFGFGFAARYVAAPHWGPYWGRGGYVHGWTHVDVTRVNVYNRWGHAAYTHASVWHGGHFWRTADTHRWFGPHEHGFEHAAYRGDHAGYDHGGHDHSGHGDPGHDHGHASHGGPDHGHSAGGHAAPHHGSSGGHDHGGGHAAPHHGSGGHSGPYHGGGHADPHHGGSHGGGGHAAPYHGGGHDHGGGHGGPSHGGGGHGSGGGHGPERRHG